MVNKTQTESAAIKTLSEMLKALGHPSRISIMLLLCNSKTEKMIVKTIYESMKLPQPIISRHLGILKNCGLLKRSVQGQDTYYELRTDNEYVLKIKDCFKSIKQG